MVPRGCGTVFGGQGQLGAFAAQVEVGVAPAVEFAGAAQGLSRAAGLGVLARVVNDHDGQLKFPLELPEEGEQCGDLDSVVFVHPVKANQRVQHQQDRPLLLDREGEALLVRRGIQSE